MTKEQQALLVRLPPEFQIFWELMKSYIDAKFEETQEATAAQFELVGLQLDRLEARVTALEGDMKEVKQDIAVLKKDVKQIKITLRSTVKTVNSHETRLQCLEQPG